MGIEVTLDEADKKARAMGFDPLAVRDKDPNFHYRWINKKSLNVAWKKHLGYEMVNGKEASVLNESTQIKKGADTTSAVEVGDLVLARIPKEQHEAYRREQQRRTREMSAAVTQSAKNAINRSGAGNVAFEEHGPGKGYKE